MERLGGVVGAVRGDRVLRSARSAARGLAAWTVSGPFGPAWEGYGRAGAALGRGGRLGWRASLPRRRTGRVRSCQMARRPMKLARA